MHIVKLHDVDDHTSLFDEIADVLGRGGLACFPCNGSYRIAVDLQNADAVIRLFQSKRRVGKAPALVFVDGAEMLARVAATIDPLAHKLVSNFWPGPLTILFDAHPDLDRRVVRELTKANGKIGVRVPDDNFAAGVVRRFGGPLLVSSANRENRAGETSPAQVRQTFMHRIDVFIDAGDLSPAPHSTVVEVSDDAFSVAREGAISLETLAAVEI